LRIRRFKPAHHSVRQLRRVRWRVQSSPDWPDGAWTSRPLRDEQSFRLVAHSDQRACIRFVVLRGFKCSRAHLPILSSRRTVKLQTPSSKLQRNTKLQISNASLFGAWNLKFLWSLELGVWSFWVLSLLSCTGAEYYISPAGN